MDVLGAWVAENPGYVLLAALALPLLAILWSELRGGSPTGIPESPPPEPAAPQDDTEVAGLSTPAPAQYPPVERRPPAARPVLEPERVAVPEPEVEPEPLVVPEPEPEPPAVPEPELEPEPEPEPAPRARLRDRLRRTSDALVGRIGELLGGRKLDAELLDELEMLLFSADLGVKTAESLLEEVRSAGSGKSAEEVRFILKSAILEKLRKVEPARGLHVEAKPHVVLVLGVNGAGKTTTIGKLAARYAAGGHTVLLGAADTFRAAAIEQLQVWGERVGCEVIAGAQGGDPSAVAFDTVKAARSRGAEVVIIDTAGRLQTKKPLMEELGKMSRVIGRDIDGAPHETLLVLDANTGQNAISQAKLFTEVAPVTGLVLTKLDGTAKGGVIVGLADEFGIPVQYVGVGESVEDLREFDAEEFVDALFREGD